MHDNWIGLFIGTWWRRRISQIEYVYWNSSSMMSRVHKILFQQCLSIDKSFLRRTWSQHLKEVHICDCNNCFKTRKCYCKSFFSILCSLCPLSCYVFLVFGGINALLSIEHSSITYSRHSVLPGVSVFTNICWKERLHWLRLRASFVSVFSCFYWNYLYFFFYLFIWPGFPVTALNRSAKQISLLCSLT